jgi:hypothetical protein
VTPDATGEGTRLRDGVLAAQRVGGRLEQFQRATAKIGRLRPPRQLDEADLIAIVGGAQAVGRQRR